MSGPRRVCGLLERAGARARQHLRIAQQFVRIGVIRKAQFRVEFLNQVLMDVSFYALHVLSFEFLFEHTGAIAGWERSEVRVFLGALFVSDAFMMVWMGQSWLFGEDLKKGNLDPVRVRPAEPAFLYFFQRFSLEGLTNMAIALVYLGWALSSAGLLAQPLTWLLLPWAVLLACWGRVLVVVLFSISELVILNSDLSRFAHTAFGEINDRPLDVFRARVKAFLLYVVPIGALNYVPASILLGRLQPLAGLLHTALYLVLGLIVLRLWRASFRRYESAMS